MATKTGKLTPRGLSRNSVVKFLTVPICPELLTVDVKKQTNKCLCMTDIMLTWAFDHFKQAGAAVIFLIAFILHSEIH